jgi:hypothetical protein
VRSNFGIAWEPSGLDIDGGEFSAEAKPLRSIIRALEEYVRKPDQPNVDRLDADDQRLVQPLAKLAHLKRRDILELQASASVAHDRPKNFDEELYDGWSSQDTFQSDKVDPGKVIKSDAVDPGKVIKALRTVHEQLESKFPGETFSLLTVSASKRLHFTLPENGPVELWFFLTWMAPAILFTFLSRAICHSPHELLQQYRQERQKSSAGVPYAY